MKIRKKSTKILKNPVLMFFEFLFVVSPFEYHIFLSEKVFAVITLVAILHYRLP